MDLPGWFSGLLPPRKPPPLHPDLGRVGPESRRRCFEYEELARRDKLNLDIFWLRDKSLEDAEGLPEPDVLAQEIADDLQAAMEQFAAIANELRE